MGRYPQLKSQNPQKAIAKKLKIILIRLIHKNPPLSQQNQHFNFLCLRDRIQPGFIKSSTTTIIIIIDLSSSHILSFATPSVYHPGVICKQLRRKHLVCISHLSILRWDRRSFLLFFSIGNFAWLSVFTLGALL